MKYLDKGVVYIPANKHITKDEMNNIKNQYKNQTVVFIRNGQTDIKTVLSNLLRASL